MASEGASVVVDDIDLETAKVVAQGICDEGGNAFGIQADVSRDADVARLVEETVSRLGRLDILVNNAGVDLVAATQDTGVDEWQRMLAVDLGGAFLCAKHSADHLARDRSGVIVNISSIHASTTLPGRAAYASAKAGLTGLTRALALDLGPRGIRVNAILPGYIRTDIWNLWLDSVPDREGLVKRIADQHPLRRIGTPGDIAGVVAFLASDDAAFISGAMVVVDGGFTVMFQPPPTS
jgi:NAD(P)-dependent dehydrogenase (short-subunit alcohol dehydrogenase family)